MKKLLMILLTIVLVLHAAGASARSDERSTNDLTIGAGADSTEEPERTPAVARTRKPFPVPQDIVAIQDGIFTITSSGVTANIQLPYGWIGFTQDLKLQLSDYLEYYDDPLAFVEALIADGVSLLAWDTALIAGLTVPDAQIRVYFKRNTYSEQFIDFQDQATHEEVLRLYQEGAEQDEEVSGAVINGRYYIRYLLSNEGRNSLVYFTFLNGVLTELWLYPQDKRVTPGEEENLVSLLETTSLE